MAIVVRASHCRLTYSLANRYAVRRFIHRCCHLATVAATIHAFSLRPPDEDVKVIQKILMAALLMTATSVASAHDSCLHIFWFEICPPPHSGPVQAPEIDPASAAAGLTMLLGGLAVLRGRR